LFGSFGRWWDLRRFVPFDFIVYFFDCLYHLPVFAFFIAGFFLFSGTPGLFVNPEHIFYFDR